jgi:hypothetical protein
MSESSHQISPEREFTENRAIKDFESESSVRAAREMESDTNVLKPSQHFPFFGGHSNKTNVTRSDEMPPEAPSSGRSQNLGEIDKRQQSEESAVGHDGAANKESVSTGGEFVPGVGHSISGYGASPWTGGELVPGVGHSISGYGASPSTGGEFVPGVGHSISGIGGSTSSAAGFVPGVGHSIGGIGNGETAPSNQVAPAGGLIALPNLSGAASMTPLGAFAVSPSFYAPGSNWIGNNSSYFPRFPYGTYSPGYFNSFFNNYSGSIGYPSYWNSGTYGNSYGCGYPSYNSYGSYGGGGLLGMLGGLFGIGGSGGYSGYGTGYGGYPGFGSGFGGYGSGVGYGSSFGPGPGGEFGNVYNNDLANIPGVWGGNNQYYPPAPGTGYFGIPNNPNFGQSGAIPVTPVVKPSTGVPPTNPLPAPPVPYLPGAHANVSSPLPAINPTHVKRNEILDTLWAQHHGLLPNPAQNPTSVSNLNATHGSGTGYSTAAEGLAKHH